MDEQPNYSAKGWLGLDQNHHLTSKGHIHHRLNDKPDARKKGLLKKEQRK